MKHSFVGVSLMAAATVLTAGCSSGSSSTSAPASQATTTSAASAGAVTSAAAGSSAAAGASSTTQPAATSSASQAASSAPTTGGASAALTALGIGNPTPANCKGKKYTFGVDVFSDSQDYAVSWLKGIKQVAASMGCVSIVSLSDNADASTALGNIKTFVQRKVDGVILFQIIAGAQPGIMNALNAAKIPVVAHAVPATGATFISPNDKTAGLTGGEALGKAAAAKFAGKTPWLLLGTDAATGAVSDNRLGGVKQGVLESVKIPADHIIDIPSQSKPDVALQATAGVLAKIPSGDPILFSGINDDVVSGILQALKAGKRLGTSLGVGMGGLYPSGVQMTCQNPTTIVGTVDFLPETAGQYMVPALVARVGGAKLPASIDMSVKLLDKAGAQAKYPTFAPCKGA